MNIETVPPHRSVPTTRWSVGLLALGAVAVLGVLVLVSPTLRSPAFVERVRVHNPHPWNAEVEVSDRHRSGWLPLGTVARGKTGTFEGVIDQGDTWVVRFTYGGHDGAELVAERTELERANWTITVPDSFAQHMKEAGVGESAG